MIRLACLLSALLFLFVSNLLTITSNMRDRQWSSALSFVGGTLLILLLASVFSPAVHRNLKLMLGIIWGIAVACIVLAMI